MDIVDVLVPLPVGAAPYAPAAVVRDAGFDARWAAWVMRGRAHERRARRRLVIWGSVFTMGAAIIYALLRS